MSTFPASIQDYANLYPICDRSCEVYMGTCEVSAFHNLVNKAHFIILNESQARYDKSRVGPAWHLRQIG